MELLRGIFAATALFLCTATASSAATFFGTTTLQPFCTPWPCNGPDGGVRGPIELTFAVPTDPTGPGLMSLTAWGDFNLQNEYLIVYAEHMLIGNFLNNDPDDDLFDDDGLGGYRWIDRGSEYGYPRLTPGGASCSGDGCIVQTPRTGTVLIPLADLQLMVADGFFTTSIWLANHVSDGPTLQTGGQEEFLTASLSFATPDVITDVPVPLSVALLGSAICALGVFRRRTA